MQVYLLSLSAFGVEAYALSKHFFLDEREKFALLVGESVDGFVVSQCLIEENLEDAGAGVLSALLMSLLVKIDDFFLGGTQEASEVLREL